MIHSFLKILLIGCALFLLVSGVKAVEIHHGPGDFVFGLEQGNRNKPVKVWYFRPANFNSRTPIVFVMHGVERNGKAYRDAWADLARDRNFLLICPEFSKADYPTRAYQLGNILDESGAPVARENWTYSTIENLFDFVKKQTFSTVSSYCIYGHSAGAQFVHRLVLFLPSARYSRAIAANPGWYTLPDSAVKFPYGLGLSGVSPTEISPAFGRDFLLLLGEEDSATNSENLRQTPEAEAQGKNRFERGQNYFNAAQKAAANLKAPFHWKLQTVAGAGHSNRQMETAAAAAFFSSH